MRIGIYLHPWQEGGGRYMVHLAQALARVAPEHSYHIYFENGWVPPTLAQEQSVVLRPLSSDAKTSWERTQRELPQQLSRDRIDVYHCHFHRFPVAAPCKTVVTLHDLIPMVAAATTAPFGHRRSLRERFLATIRLADHIVVSSLYTKERFLRRLAVAPHRITQIYPGCPEQFRPLPREKAAWAAEKLFGLRRPFFLSVGTLIPRKNYPLLIRAFREELSKTHDLVFVGAIAWWGKRLLRLIRDEPSIRYLGPVPDRDLLSLTCAADCLVYPSLLEGFGFPPLEAMACGTPVVASNGSSIPEVVGESGLLVKPGSIGELRVALQRIAQEAGLRERLRQQGFRQAGRFRWEETARQTLAVYERVVHSYP